MIRHRRRMVCPRCHHRGMYVAVIELPGTELGGGAERGLARECCCDQRCGCTFWEVKPLSPDERRVA